jgi:adenylate kinase family enzyme
VRGTKPKRQSGVPLGITKNEAKVVTEAEPPALSTAAETMGAVGAVGVGSESLPDRSMHKPCGRCHADLKSDSCRRPSRRRDAPPENPLTLRTVVIGTSGSGKTTFAKSLSEALACPHIGLDHLHWGPNWTAVPTDRFAAAVRTATAGERWVADGNYSAVRDVLWPRATHIVWLNYGRFTVFSRLLRRTLARGLTGAEVCNGNRESLLTAFGSKDSVLLWSLTTYAGNRVKFRRLQQEPRFAHLQWTEVVDPARADEALRRLAGAGAVRG